MSIFTKELTVRWSDLDPNFHLRHSVYYDYGAYCRIAFLEEQGINATMMHEHHFGPIIFREEAQFKREVRQGDRLHIDLKLVRSTRDYGRWTIQHHIYKNNDTIAAIITVDGAFIDTIKRKLTLPPEMALKAFETMPKGEAFEWI
ncbi:thioesterase family protein [Flavihumibacter rivuli]|uniref:acyl-CoA thioesterase n=1 Tax=Flavihumibacter rivuli TaxID=2838156 RepID=UPI001BDE04CA|nr:acyl-CoA thioesterase [Flavihumibacter rivuli]ULQ57320.1 thioesterase family protein [Flavihumibacter rivuli]